MYKECSFFVRLETHHTIGFSPKNRLTRIGTVTSLSTVVLIIVGIGKKLYGFGKISRFKNQPCNKLYPKKQLECIGKAVMMLYLG